MNLLSLLTAKAPGCYRQGDVFIVPVSALPETGLRAHRPVLAEGEVTGHAHRLDKSDEAQVLSNSHGLFLDVRAESATIIHDEHDPVTIPKGHYEIRIQREYHPTEIRRSAD